MNAEVRFADIRTMLSITKYISETFVCQFEMFNGSVTTVWTDISFPLRKELERQFGSNAGMRELSFIRTR